MIETTVPSRGYPSLLTPPPFQVPGWKPIPGGRLREIRVTCHPATLPAKRGFVVEGPGDIFRVFRRLACQPVEVFRVAFLDSHCRLLSFEDISRGTVDRALIHPREVFHSAVLLRASAVVVMHPHPDGDPGASRHDIEITRRLRQAGEVMGIRLLDHLIIGQDGYYSFHDRGWPCDPCGEAAERG